MFSYVIYLEFLGLKHKGNLMSTDDDLDFDLQVFVEKRTRKWISLNINEKYANLEIKFLGSTEPVNLKIPFSEFIDENTLNAFYRDYKSNPIEFEQNLYMLSKEYLYNWFEDNLSLDYVKNTNQ